MKSGNWVAMDKDLIEALPKKRAYTVIEAVFSVQLDRDAGKTKSMRSYSRIFNWSMNKTTAFLKNCMVTRTEQSKNTHETVRFRFIKPLRDCMVTRTEQSGVHARDTTYNPNPLIPNPKEKKENGVTSNDAHPVLSFPAFRSKYNASPDALKAIEYFLKKYKSHRKEDHPPLKESQWKNIVNTFIDGTIDDLGRSSVASDLDSEQLSAMIDHYFKKKCYQDCDYRLSHFTSNGIFTNLFYEVCY